MCRVGLDRTLLELIYLNCIKNYKEREGAACAFCVNHMFEIVSKTDLPVVLALIFLNLTLLYLWQPHHQAVLHFSSVNLSPQPISHQPVNHHLTHYQCF